MTALHVAPLPREFMGFRPERKNLFDFAAPDRQWLALTQYVSETSLQKSYGPWFDAPRFERIPGDKETIFHAHQKVAHRAHAEVEIERGNHNADAPGLEPLRAWHPIEVMHFSFRSLAQGIEYEIARQTEIVSRG